MLRIKLVKSPIGNVPRNRATVAALGLRKINQVVEHQDSPMIRGMIHKVKHMIVVEEAEGTPKSNLANKRRGTAVAAKPAKAAAKPKAEKAEKEEKAVKTPAAKEKAPSADKPKRTTKKASTEEEK
jgi:large subunit ribosomal protein L30